MSTPVSGFREIVRFLIGDSDPDIHIREDAQIDIGIRGIVDLGKVTGTEVDGYSIDSGRANVVPDLTAASDPLAFAQLAYQTAKHFIRDISPTSWRTRAFSESTGDNYNSIFGIIDDLYKLENGEGCASSDYT